MGVTVSKSKNTEKEVVAAGNEKKKVLPPVRDYTRDEVSKHNDPQNDFWIIVNIGTYYGVYDITAMTRDPTLHPGPVCKFNRGFIEAERNNFNGNDVSLLMGTGTPQSHCWFKWPNAMIREKYNMIFMGECTDPIKSKYDNLPMID